MWWVILALIMLAGPFNLLIYAWEEIWGAGWISGQEWPFLLVNLVNCLLIISLFTIKKLRCRASYAVVIVLWLLSAPMMLLMTPA